MASASLEISHFNQAIKSFVSKLGDKRLKEITSLRTKKSHTWLPYSTRYVCVEGVDRPTMTRNLVIVRYVTLLFCSNEDISQRFCSFV